MDFPGYESPEYAKWAEMWNTIPLYLPQGYHNYWTELGFDAEEHKEFFNYGVEEAEAFADLATLYVATSAFTDLP